MWLLVEVPSGSTQATPGAAADLHTFTLCAQADGAASVAGVGRRARDPQPSAGSIVLENQSISRVHAEVRCCAQQPEEARQRLEVVDKSKFGSFVNGSRLTKGETVLLGDGDEVRFGTVAKAATFRVSWRPLFILCSSVDKANKKALQKLCPVLGAKVLSSWSDRVTHLVQDKIVMTEKAMLALIDGVPIVTHDFFTAVLSRAEAVTALPHVQAFLPEVSQGTTQSVVQEDFQVNPARKTMLCGHLFFFFTEKQHKKHSTVIRQAGGEAIVLSSEPPHTGDPVQAEMDRRGDSCPVADKMFFIDVESSSQLSQGMSSDEAEAVAMARQRCREHGVRKVRDTEVLQGILRGGVISEAAESLESRAAAEPFPAKAAAAAPVAVAKAATGVKRAADTEPEGPAPAATRRRTKATQSPKDKPAAASASASASESAAPVSAATAGGETQSALVMDSAAASPELESSPAPVKRTKSNTAARRPPRGGSRRNSEAEAAAPPSSVVPVAGTPNASTAASSRSRWRSASKPAASVAAPDTAADMQDSAQVDEELETRMENAPRRKAPPLSSTIFSQPSRRIGTTPDQRVVHGSQARAHNPADRDVIVDDGLLTKDLNLAPPARKNFKRFKKKGASRSDSPARQRPKIPMKLHNASDLARAVDRVVDDDEEDSDDDNNLFTDDQPTSRGRAPARRAGSGNRSGVVQRRRGR